MSESGFLKFDFLAIVVFVLTGTFFISKQTSEVLAEEYFSQESYCSLEVSDDPILKPKTENFLSFINNNLEDLSQKENANDKNIPESIDKQEAPLEEIVPEIKRPEVAAPESKKIVPPKNISKSSSYKNAPIKKAQPSSVLKNKDFLGGGIGKPGKIAVKTKVVNGKRICASMKKDHPSKSKNNKKWHIDAECCLDKDETPNSRCYYPPQKYSKLIQRYLN